MDIIPSLILNSGIVSNEIIDAIPNGNSILLCVINPIENNQWENSLKQWRLLSSNQKIHFLEFHTLHPG